MTSLAGRIARTIRQDVVSTHAYAIQSSAGLIKLDAMENPFRLPPELQRALEGLLELDAMVKGVPGSEADAAQRRLAFTLWVGDHARRGDERGSGPG